MNDYVLLQTVISGLTKVFFDSSKMNDFRCVVSDGGDLWVMKMVKKVVGDRYGEENYSRT